MTSSTLEFLPDSAIGRAFRIDTSSVWAEATDHERLTRTSVGSLIAFQGANGSEYLVGMLDRVTRQLQDEAIIDDDAPLDEFTMETRQRDLLRVVLLGTYRTVDGTRRDTFKRGADSYPLVESLCWVIDGSNLQKLMGLLSNQLEPEKRLQLGVFVADPTATAVADGDRLFQRHAALLGSTGSGKSWSVALMLERARALANPNLIVFDMHGEYAPLTTGDLPIANGFRIAGPGDIGDSESDVLYLPWWLLNQEEMQSLLLDRSEANAPNQASRLTHHVRSLKSEALLAEGRTELSTQFTVDSPVPYSLKRLLECLVEDDEEMVPGKTSAPVKGAFNGKLTRFTARLRGRIEERKSVV